MAESLRLSVSYQPLDQVGETLSYDDEPVSLGDLNGHFYEYEFADRSSTVAKWTVYNTVSWEQDGQFYTLTLVDDKLGWKSLITSAAENLALQPYRRELAKAAKAIPKSTMRLNFHQSRNGTEKQNY